MQSRINDLPKRRCVSDVCNCSTKVLKAPSNCAAQRMIRRCDHFLHQRDDALDETVDDISVEARGRVSRSLAELRLQHARVVARATLQRPKSMFHERLMPIASRRACFSTRPAARDDIERAQTRQHHPIEEARDFVLVDRVQQAGQRFDERIRDRSRCSRVSTSHCASAFAALWPLSLRDDQLGLQKILFDEPAETLRDALADSADDRRMRHRQSRTDAGTARPPHTSPRSRRPCPLPRTLAATRATDTRSSRTTHANSSTTMPAEQTRRRAPHAGHPASFSLSVAADAFAATLRPSRTASSTRS